MAGFLKSIFGGDQPPKPPSRKGEKLIGLLQNYSANPPPFPGDKKALTDKQRDANVAHIIATASARVAALGGLLAEFSIAVAPLCDSAADALPTAHIIDAWLTAELPDHAALPLSAPANAPYGAFMQSDRSGPHILFTLAADLGVLEGEAIRARDPRFIWTVDRDRAHRGLEMYRRPCLFKAGQTDWAPTAIDFEFQMLAIIYERGRMGAIHRFGDSLEALSRGAFDPSPTGFY